MDQNILQYLILLNEQKTEFNLKLTPIFIHSVLRVPKAKN